MKNFVEWKNVLCQHPMYLLIDRDRGKPIVGERIPPWGAPNAKEYVKRIKRNLKSLEKFPDLKINYQFSGVEMEDMARNFPEVIEEIRKWVKKGKVGFIGGTYSQPHLHVFGSESNVRQFEYGLEVFKKIFGYRIIVYARQETGLHQQLPQILNAFGYKFAVVPAFYWALRFVDGSPFPEIIGNSDFQSFVQGEEFTYWQGLDKSNIPLYLKSSSTHTEEDEQRDLFHSPILCIDFPDMQEVSENWYQEKRKMGSFYLIDEALKEREGKYPPTSRAKLYAYWSYIEGVWAEALLRKNKKAEVKAIQAEAMVAMARLAEEQMEAEEKIDKIWKHILTSQHHDVYWIETTDLKKRALNWLDEAIRISGEIIEQAESKIVKKIDTGKEKEKALIVFNTLPRERKGIIKVKTEGNIKIVNGKNKELSAQRIEDEINLIDTLPAFGYKVYKLRKEENGSLINIKKVDLEDLGFENQYYKAKIKKDGLFESIIEKGSGQELLDTKAYLGGEIRGYIRNRKVSTRNRGRITKIEEGEIGKLIKIDGSLEDIKYKERITLYNDLPIIDVNIDFSFKGDEVGTFWIDESKLNIYWPTQGGKISYDIPFGIEEGKEERPLFAINWLDISTDKCGLTYINKGTPKHWVRNGVIANVIAWGGNKFSNRHHLGWLKQTQYDLKLYGSHTISYSLYPHKNGWKQAKVTEIVQNLLSPPLVCLENPHKGVLQREKSFFTLLPDSLVVTSIQSSEGRVNCRVYNVGEKTLPEVKGANLVKICDLSGKQIDEIEKFQIANLLIKLEG